MCMVFEGTEYHYGLDVEINLHSQPKHVYILMTPYMGDKYPSYIGLCLNNASQVSANEDDRPTALCNIITRLVDGLIGAEELNAKLFPSRTVSPVLDLMKEYHYLHDVLTKGMFSLDEYNNLRKKLSPVLDTPKINIESLKEEKPKANVPLLIHQHITNFYLRLYLANVYDCKEMIVALNKLQKDARFVDSRIKYRRV